MKTLFVLALLALAGCQSASHGVAVNKFKTEDCTIGGVHYAAYYCVIVKNPGKTGDDEFTRVTVDAKEWEKIQVAAQ